MSALVTIVGVEKAFAGKTVLAGIDLSVRTGEVLCILGPSGSGKSTLLRCINHLEQPDKGIVSVDGSIIGYRLHKDFLHALTVRQLRQQQREIGMVFQHFNLFPHMTELENIIEGPLIVGRQEREQALERAMTLLASVGLADRGQAYPNQLSGGQSSV